MLQRVARGTQSGTGPGLLASTPGKCDPQTGVEPRGPHLPGTRAACRQVLWQTRGARCKTRPVECRPAQRGSRAAGGLANRARAIITDILRRMVIEGVAPKPCNAITPPPYQLLDQNGYDRSGLQGRCGSARRPGCRCATGFGNRLAESPAYGWDEFPGGEIPSAPTSLGRPAGLPLVAPRREQGATLSGTTAAAILLQQLRWHRREPVLHECCAWG